MRGKLFTGVAAIAVSILLQGANIQAAKAEAAAAVEFFKCTLVEGKNMDDLVAVTKALLKTAKENGIENYSVRFITPLYSTDISRGTHYWVGIAPNAAEMGAFNDYWDTDANKKHREKYRELTEKCEASSLYYETPVIMDE